jgi:hypothetical protein
MHTVTPLLLVSLTSACVSELSVRPYRVSWSDWRGFILLDNRPSGPHMQLHLLIGCRRAFRFWTSFRSKGVDLACGVHYLSVQISIEGILELLFC